MTHISPAPIEIHNATLIDLPLVRRLTERGVILESELSYTREVTVGTQTTWLANLILPQRSVCTLVAKSGKLATVAHLRFKTDDHLAQIVMLAPNLEEDVNDTLLMHLLDGIAVESGRRGAHILTAEVNENSPLFVTMRQSGFAVYARQEIWRLQGTVNEVPALSGELAQETDDDTMDIQLLYSNIVPRLVQPITVPSRDSDGWVYRLGGRVQGYIAVSEGKRGIYLMPFLHPDSLGREAVAIIANAIQLIQKSGRTPVYVCVRRYQDWLVDALRDLGFTQWENQAVMVRHITAGVRQPRFATFERVLEAIPNAIQTPITRINKIVSVIRQQIDKKIGSWNVG